MSDFVSALQAENAKTRELISKVSNELKAKLDEVAAAPTAEQKDALLAEAQQINEQLLAVDNLVPDAPVEPTEPEEPTEEEPTEEELP